MPGALVVVTDAATAAPVPKLPEALDNNDDTLNAHSNFDIPNEILARLSA